MNYKTPCIGVCSTGLGDAVCRGCKRLTKEVIYWNSYSYDQKAAVYRRLHQLLVMAVGDRIQIVDKKLLLEKVAHLKITTVPGMPPIVMVFELLKAGASQISDPALYGFHVEKGQNLLSLKEDIDQDFYALSQAHYDRYFAIQEVL